MPQYEYIAVNEAGQKTTGQAEGKNSSAVRDELRRSGWTVFSILEVRGDPIGLSAADAATVAQHLVQATEAGLPLTGALQALSEETWSPRLRRRLQPVYQALERGVPLEQVLQDPSLRLPRAVAGILNSGLPAMAISQLLVQVIQSAASRRELWRRAFALITYPACLLVALCGLWVFMLVYINPIFADILASFSSDRKPPLESVLIRVSEYLLTLRAAWVVPGLIVVAVLGSLGYRLISPISRRRFWCSIPFFGAMYRLSALSDIAYTLAVTLEYHVPLPQSLALAAAGSVDPDLAFLCQIVSKRIQAGESMQVVISTEPGLPAHLEQILRWTSRGTEGSEPLKGMAEMLRIKTRMLAQSTIPLLEPIMMIAAVVSLVFYAATLLTPVFRFVNLLAVLS